MSAEPSSLEHVQTSLLEAVLGIHEMYGMHNWFTAGHRCHLQNKSIDKFVVELIVDLHRPCVGCQQHVTAIASSSTHLCIILHQVSCL